MDDDFGGAANRQSLVQIGRTSVIRVRIAYVVGNSEYRHIGELDNPENDAGLIGGVLEEAGFEVTYLMNATQRELESAVVAMGRALRERGPETTGLFYFAGHGVQSGGRNYLMPVDADCRNNPFAAVQGLEANGLAEMNPAPGTFLSYATGPGDVALDGLGRHSPFSAALAAEIQRPDQSIEAAMRTGARADFEAYLAASPDGVFAELVRLELAELD